MVRLTTYAAKGGCACKIGPHILANVLRGLDVTSHDPRLLVNMEGSDDAGVFQINETQALVQTLDFFTPPVDDPYTFGRVAATNSLSDVYAMGGTPITAMNIVAFPVPLVEMGVLQDVLRGAQDTLREADVSLVGGHSIEDEVPKFGMSVTGLVHPKAFWKNSGAQPGDVLILTKPLGTGILNTAAKADMFLDGVAAALQSMTTLNRAAAEVGARFTVHACTDVTGFSLVGHACEMATGSDASIVISCSALPLFPSVVEAAEMGLVPAATYGNRKAITDVAFADDVDTVWSDIVFDPQTSGGLLMAVPEAEADAMQEALAAANTLASARVGRVIEKGDVAVYVEL